MEILRKIFRMKKSKPYKIQDCQRKIGRLGITASSLEELRQKSAEKLFAGKEEKIRIVLEEDGTEITDETYFETLPAQTAFVVLKKGEFWDGYITYLQLATKKILENTTAGTEAVKTMELLLKDPESAEMIAMINYVKDLDINVEAESIDEDPNWFEDVPGKLKTKEAVMKRIAKERVRSYLNTSKDFINNADISSTTRKALLNIVEDFRSELKRLKYFEVYFARSANTDLKFCNELGWFECEGPFNKKKCTGFHKINPYGSKDARVLFKTWNLDHKIEKSREVLPSMITAGEECPEDKEINPNYFFELLFTRMNLKLVDVRCHVISAHHDYKVDHKRVYRKRKLEK